MKRKDQVSKFHSLDQLHPMYTSLQPGWDLIEAPPAKVMAEADALMGAIGEVH